MGNSVLKGDDIMRKNTKNIVGKKTDPVTFGVCLIMGSIMAFVFSEYAGLLISLGLVFGLTLPIKLSRWIHR
jgi:hypothetical protein